MTHGFNCKLIYYSVMHAVSILKRKLDNLLCISMSVNADRGSRVPVAYFYVVWRFCNRLLTSPTELAARSIRCLVTLYKAHPAEESTSEGLPGSEDSISVQILQRLQSRVLEQYSPRATYGMLSGSYLWNKTLTQISSRQCFCRARSVKYSK